MYLLVSRLLPAFAVLFLVVGLCSARADEAEEVKEKLSQAKKTYDDELQKFKQAVTELLDKRKDDARQAGNKKLVDQIKAEREAFNKDSTPPATLTAAIRQQITTARANLDKAYTAAVKGHVRLKMDTAAEVVEKEQREFQLTSALLFGKHTHLTTLKPYNISTEQHGFEHNIVLAVQGEETPHSMRLDPPTEGASQVGYILNGKWSALRVRVGVPRFKDTVKPPVSELTFEVLGDNKSLWKSKPTNKLDEFQMCEVNVDQVKVLTLKVHCPKSGEWARACWLDPILAE
jgi:hypothetical protein